MKTALVVDDKEENLEYLRALLTGHGYRVECARQGAEALAKAQAMPPDIIVSDLLMPVMDGYTLLRHWKGDARLRSVPFIVYTATYTDPADEDLALHLGADAFLVKPVEPEAFMTLFRAVLEGQAPKVTHAVTGPAAEAEVLREYSETLIRKLEQKALELEQANQSLQRDIAARQEAEAHLRQTQEELREAQKMEAVGRLAGGIAHDFNNILSVILSYSALALESLGPAQREREDIQEVQRAGERGAALTRQLLAFSRRQVVQPRVVSLGEVVTNMKKMLASLVGDDVELSLVSGDDGARVVADPGQLEQIVMNLAVNARDAMPRGGQLVIETGTVEVDATNAALHAGAAAGRYVTLKVSDTGTGMDAETRARIFDPFFTTKEPGRGTGLGLSTVLGIVKQGGGHITVDSTPCRGATFTILLPRTALPPADPPAPPVVATLKGAETVLVVDDDESVRLTNQAILKRHGYTVLEAANAEQALALSARFPHAIDLLVTDVVMPRTTGRELADRLLAHRPGLRVLYVSGYTEIGIVRQSVLDDAVAFLPKPITPDLLLRKVREVLTASAGSCWP